MLSMLSSVLPGYLLDVQVWLIFLLTAMLVYKLLQPKTNLVPMPRSWPIVGNLLSLPRNESIHSFANRWAREINSGVIRLRLGFVDAVVLNDLASLQEALVERADDYAGRPYNTVFDLISDGYQDVAFADADTPNWRQKRKILVTALRAMSTGEAFEDRVVTVWDHVTDLLDEKLGKPFDPSEYCQLLISNYQAAACYSTSFDLEDPDFQSFNNAFRRGGKFFGKQISVDNFPFLKLLPFDMPDYKECKEVFTIVKDYGLRQVREHIKNFKPEEVRDVTDYLLQAKLEAEEQDKEAVLTDEHLALMVNDAFAAGLATQRVMVTWYWHQLAMYPDVQEKAYQEIRDVIGDRLPTTKDRSRMPYCEATIQEITRLATSTSIAVPRKTLANTSVAGYDVPKGTLIFPNHAAVHVDPAHFPDPFVLRPQRHLQNGNLTKPKALLAFGAGRRMCAGEMAAKHVIFLIFVLLLRAYKISAPAAVEMKFEPEKDQGGIGAPAPFKVVIEKRE